MDTINEETINENKKFNIKLFPFYKMLAWDMLFYYAISYLFLVQVKGLTTSQIIFADAFYPLFKFILQVPCTILIEKVGKRNSLVLGNSMIALYLLIILGLINTPTLILANLFSALGFVIKGTSESNILYDSLENSENKGETFSKLEGKSSAWYYYIDAITSIATGFLFVFNPYFPIIISFLIALFTIFISHLFKEIPTENNLDSKHNQKHSVTRQIKIYLKDLSQAFKFMLESNRLRSLIIFNAIFVSLISLTGTLMRSLLSYINVSSEYFGLIFAILGIIAGFSADRSHMVHRKYRNKSLSLLSISFTLSVLFAGLVVFLNLPAFLTYYFILILFSIQYIVKGPFYTLIKQYLSSFSNSDMRVKIYSANSIIECILRSFISFICSYLVSILSIEIVHILLGAIFTVILLYILNYMKTRVGLKPEEYKKSDISFTEVK